MLSLTTSLFFAAMVGVSALTDVPDPKISHADYANPTLWLCRPDNKDNKCKVYLTATVIPGDGNISLERFIPAKSPKIDCFFIYPTVSLAPGYQSDFIPSAHKEIDDIRDQFALGRCVPSVRAHVSSGFEKPNQAEEQSITSIR